MYISPVFQQVAMATSPAVLQKKESPLAKLMISGSVAWTFELFGGHYIEVLKIAKQTSDLSYAQITKNMVKEKGLAGVLDGYFPWGSIQCFAKGATLGFGQALGRQMLDGRVSDSTAEVLSGGVGGGFQGLVMSPILLLKTRVITDPKFRGTGGTWATTVAATKLGVELIQREGVSVLMKGAGTFTIKRVADWTTRYFFAEQVTLAVKSQKGPGQTVSFTEKMLCSLLGGVLSATVTIPIDVLVATIQDAGKAGQKVSIMQTFQEKLAKGGVKGLLAYSTRGYVARVAHVGLTTMLMKTVSSAVYDRYRDN